MPFRMQNEERRMQNKMHDNTGVSGALFFILTSAFCSQVCRILQSKGFAGGVPLNTERAAVKPRVGIAKYQEVFVLC